MPAIVYYYHDLRGTNISCNLVFSLKMYIMRIKEFMKSMKKIILILSLTVANAFALNWYDYYVSTGFNFGYSVKKGFSWGPKVSLGLYTNFEKPTTGFYNLTYGVTRIPNDSTEPQKEYYFEVQGGVRMYINDSGFFGIPLYNFGGVGIALLKGFSDSLIVKPRVSLNSGGPLGHYVGVSQTLAAKELEPSYKGLTFYGGPSLVPINILYPLSKWD